MNSKSWLQSKTMLFNLLIAALTVLSEQSDLVKIILSDDVGYGKLMLFVALCNGYLRLQTTLPVTITKPSNQESKP
jgi:hypothetical protein